MKTEKKIQDVMTEYPSIASEKMSVTEAVEFMKKAGIRHLPVVKNSIVIGVVTDRDLRQAEILSDSMTLLVSDVMSVDPYCVKVGTPLSTVAREMSKKKYGSVVVLNDINRIVGIFTTTDGMRILSDLLDGKDTSGFKLLSVEHFLDPRAGYLT